MLIALVATGGLGLCAGWAATPEARMACCTEGAGCPMHELADDGAAAMISQADADRCCAASERDTPPAASSMLALTTALAPVATPAVMLPAPAISRADAWRGLVPLPGRVVATHLLLSVFLI